MTTGEKIRKMRKDRGLSIEELAARLNISPSAISQFERGALRPSIVALVEIAYALNCDVYDICDDSDSTRVLTFEMHMQCVGSALDINVLPAFQKKVVRCLASLNDVGSLKVYEYANDLTHVPYYRLENEYSQKYESERHENEE